MQQISPKIFHTLCFRLKPGFMECLAYKGLEMSQYSFIQTTGRYNVRKSTVYLMFSFWPLTFLSQRNLVLQKFDPQEMQAPRNLVPKKFGPHLNTQDDFSKCPNYYCRFALGPLELRVIKTLDGSTSSAAAITGKSLSEALIFASTNP